MKKKIILIVAPSFLFLILLLTPLLGGSSDEPTGNGAFGTVSNINLSDAALAHQPMVEKYAAQYDIYEYVPWLMAIMMVESGGTAVDVMQSSESLGLPVNTLDTEASIEQACKFFSELLSTAEWLECDLNSVIQSYNYGGGFLYYVQTRGKNYTFQLAMSFSEMMSGGVKVSYKNDISIPINGGWRYDYGNFFYVKLVMQYIVISSADFIWPSNDGNVITSSFGGRYNPVTGQSEFHQGVDIGGSNFHGTPILAVADGRVIASAFQESYGNYIMIEHARGYVTLYAHMSKRNVSKGATVNQGQIIGLVGSTGNSTGPHIHLEFRLDGEYINPLDYYPENLYVK